MASGRSRVGYSNVCTPKSLYKVNCVKKLAVKLAVESRDYLYSSKFIQVSFKLTIFTQDARYLGDMYAS